MGKELSKTAIAALKREIMGFIKEKEKVSVDEISSVFSLSKKDVFDIIWPLLQKDIVGVEYKFTTPYFYVSKENYEEKDLMDEKDKKINGQEEQDSNITALINDLKGCLNSDRIEEAADTFDRIIKSLNSANDLRMLPDILEISRVKEQLNKKLAFYFNPDNLEKSVNSLIEKSRSYLKNGKVLEAKRFYDEAFGLFSKMPSDFIQHKSTMGFELVELYKELNIRYLKILSVKAIEVAEHVSSLLKTGHNYLAEDNFDGAFEICRRCVESLSEMPKPFLKKRFRIYNELFDFYKEISLKADIKRLQNEIT